jgi:hypothetical protein
MKHLRSFLFIASLLNSIALVGQTPVQTIRGTVSDGSDERPLASASVVLLETQPPFGATTAANGSFFIENVPVGRYRLQASYLGYETLTLPEVLVEAGKELVLHIVLSEKSEALQEVIVKAPDRDNGAQPLSAHTMTVEEQFRFPTTYYDPARLAMTLPGVTGENDGTNIMSIRGNAPGALNWRLEGVDIVNPNHTANAGTFSDRPTVAGGGVNILSAQLLDASKFLTGAFAAEYGNSLGGIFDMRFRKGNDRQHEFVAQAGLIGLEAAAEGPLSKNKDTQAVNPSYLVNYRYSFTGLLTNLGVDFGDEEIYFQDLSFNLALPTRSAGQFTLFGMGGKSGTKFRSPGDSSLITEDKQRYNIDFLSNMGAAGITYVLPLGKKSVLRSVLALSALQHERTADLATGAEPMRQEQDEFEESKLAFRTSLSQKINAKNSVAVGVYLTRLTHDVLTFDSAFIEGSSEGLLTQPYFEWRSQLLPKLRLTAGLHGSFFSLNKDCSIEPRVAVGYQAGARNVFSFAYGLHSQVVQPALIGEPNRHGHLRNNDLDFSKSHHWVAGFRRIFGKALIFNAEAYYQQLFDVPVSADTSSKFSFINLVETPVPDRGRLEKNGKGRNYGLDVWLQKFLSERYYFLLAGSLYRSFYTPSDRRERPSRFDGRYLLNLTGGREFSKNKKNKVVLKGVNARLTWFGGYRATPIDVTRSTVLGKTVFVESEAFSLKQPDYLRFDLRFYLKWNRPERNSTFSLDLQNVANRRNTAYEYFDTVLGKVTVKKQLGLIPLMSYRMEF